MTLNTRHNYIIVQNYVIIHKTLFRSTDTSVHYVLLEIGISASKHQGWEAFKSHVFLRLYRFNEATSTCHVVRAGVPHASAHAESVRDLAEKRRLQILASKSFVTLFTSDTQ